MSKNAHFFIIILSLKYFYGKMAVRDKFASRGEIIWAVGDLVKLGKETAAIESERDAMRTREQKAKKHWPRRRPGTRPWGAANQVAGAPIELARSTTS